MTLEEQNYIDRSRPDSRPPNSCYRMIFRPTNMQPERLLERFRTVWRIVASWGRYCDEGAGEWPSTAACLAALPTEFARSLVDHWSVDIEGWLDDVHDRDWILWSSEVRGSEVIIDLDANSMPMSTWPLRLVFEVLGAEVVFADLS